MGGDAYARRKLDGTVTIRNHLLRNAGDLRFQNQPNLEQLVQDTEYFSLGVLAVVENLERGRTSASRQQNSCGLPQASYDALGRGRLATSIEKMRHWVPWDRPVDLVRL